MVIDRRLFLLGAFCIEVVMLALVTEKRPELATLRKGVGRDRRNR
jgi:hypothetical protein